MLPQHLFYSLCQPLPLSTEYIGQRLEKWDKLADTFEVLFHKYLQTDCIIMLPWHLPLSLFHPLLTSYRVYKSKFGLRNAQRKGEWKLFGGWTQRWAAHWVLLLLLLALVVWAVSGLLIRQRHASHLIKLAKKREMGALSLGGSVKIIRRGNAMGAKFGGSSLCHVGLVTFRFA